MMIVALPMISPPSPKRSYDRAGLGHIGPGIEDSRQEPMTSEPSLMAHGETIAPPELHPLPSMETRNFMGSPFISSSLAPPSTAEKPSKRVRLSVADKEAKRLEKEGKDLQKSEKKARKEEEKAKKDEERKKAKEVKEQRARVREEEKQRKEDEKMKKARSQLRLNAFFQQPSNVTSGLTGSQVNSPTNGNESSALSSRRSSIVEINTFELERRSRSASVQASPLKSRILDYKRSFPNFFLQSHTILAPQNRFYRHAEKLEQASRKIDVTLLKEDQEDTHSIHGIDDLFHLLPKKGRQFRKAVSMKEVIHIINSSSKNSINFMDTNSKDTNATDALRNIPVKVLKFAEDVRPPYIGTYSKTPIYGSITSLARNPLARVRPDTNYNYDSEAEWEDPGDGEDLDSEGEEEGEEEDEGEMEGFLDDEEPNSIKRRPLLGNQEPTSSGICWEGEPLSSNGSMPPDLRSYQIDILLENPAFPIDPFSTAYWAPAPPPPPAEKTSSTRLPSNQSTLMEPPRIPLSPITHTNNTLLKPPSTTNTSTNKAPNPPKRFVDSDVLDEFKAAVIGSDLTKMGLCEVLKKRFPKQKKDAIKDTLEAVAERVGEKNADKKWFLKKGV